VLYESWGCINPLRGVENSFPWYTLLKVGCTIAVTSCECERNTIVVEVRPLHSTKAEVRARLRPIRLSVEVGITGARRIFCRGLQA